MYRQLKYWILCSVIAYSVISCSDDTNKKEIKKSSELEVIIGKKTDKSDTTTKYKSNFLGDTSKTYKNFIKQ